MEGFASSNLIRKVGLQQRHSYTDLGILRRRKYQCERCSLIGFFLLFRYREQRWTRMIDKGNNTKVIYLPSEAPHGHIVLRRLVFGINKLMLGNGNIEALSVAGDRVWISLPI